MNALFDSGALVKLIIPEHNSPTVDALAESLSTPFPLTELQEGEVKTAIRLKCARREISLDEMEAALRDFERETAGRRLERVALDWPAVWRRTEALSVAHARVTFCRTLNILHVAAALELGVEDLVCLDRRQRAMAERAGLNVLPAAPAVPLPVASTP